MLSCKQRLGQARSSKYTTHPSTQPTKYSPTNHSPINLTNHLPSQPSSQPTNEPQNHPTYLSYLSLIMRFWNSEEGALLKLSRRSDCFSWMRPGPWWLGCLWRWGLRSAMLMSFRRRGNGPSLMMASWRKKKKERRFEGQCVGMIRST